MFSGERLTGLSSDQGLLALLAQNRLRDTLLVAAIVFCETGLVGMPFLPGRRVVVRHWRFGGAVAGSAARTDSDPRCGSDPRRYAQFSIGRSRLGGQMTCTKNYMSWFLLATVVVSLPPVLVQVTRGCAASNP